MKSILFTFFYLLCIVALGQSTPGENVTNKVGSFNYKCERVIGDKIKPIKLTILNFTQEQGRIDLEFKTTINCAQTEKGTLLVVGDTLKIFDNNTIIETTTYKDALGNEITKTVLADAMMCTCLSRYTYRIDGPMKKLKFLRFWDESVALTP